MHYNTLEKVQYSQVSKTYFSLSCDIGLILEDITKDQELS